MLRNASAKTPNRYEEVPGDLKTLGGTAKLKTDRVGCIRVLVLRPSRLCMEPFSSKMQAQSA